MILTLSGIVLSMLLVEQLAESFIVVALLLPILYAVHASKLRCSRCGKLVHKHRLPGARMDYRSPNILPKICEQCGMDFGKLSWP
jgi:hypothetical protein